MERNAHFTEWLNYTFVYAPGQKCKLRYFSLTGEEITKTVNDLAPEDSGKGFCPHSEFPTSAGTEPKHETINTAAQKTDEVKLTEEQPLFAETVATSLFKFNINIELEVCFLFICKSYSIVNNQPAWEIALPWGKRRSSRSARSTSKGCRRTRRR